MKNFWLMVCMALVVVVIVASAVMFQVRETETVIVTRLGKPVRPITEPGLQFKWFPPIEKVHRFDSRSQLLEYDQITQTSTAGGEPILITSYLVWRIERPETFLESLRTVESAKETLKSQLQNAQNSVIGRHYFNEFVNTNPDLIRFEKIEGEIADAIRQESLDKYGIEICSVGIKRLKLPAENTEKVFNRMKADRERKTKAIIASGTEKAKTIRSDALAKQKEILAIAEMQAQKIRGTGEGEAAKYYRMLEADPEFAMFLRDIEALKKILAERSTIILGPETQPIQLLNKLPDIKPEQQPSQAGN